MGTRLIIDLHRIWAQNAADKILTNLKEKGLLSAKVDERKVRAEIVETLVEEAKNLPS